MELHPDGIKNLITAIYRQTAHDYKKALKNYDEKEAKRLEEFLRGGYYGVKPSVGEKIIMMVRKEVREEQRRTKMKALSL